MVPELRADRGGLDLHLKLSGTRPARALESALRDAILERRLVPGQRLPPTRSLAADLGIARATVSDVYAQLVAEGWLEARVGAGTWVAKTTGSVVDNVPEVGRGGPPPSRRPIKLIGGLPDASPFPRREWLAATRRALDAATTEDLGYAGPGGVEQLRDELAAYLRRTRGVDAGPDQVLVGHGFGSMLSLICRTLVARGAQRLAVEEYGHPEHCDIIRAAGLDIVPLPVDDRGADVGAPDAARLVAGRVDGVLLTPAHQFPLGTPLSAERRRSVVGWARAMGGLIIEDDYDGEFRYDRRSIGALQGMAPDVVAYLGTASKALAPAVGLSWAVVPEQWRAPLLRQRQVLDLPHDALNQLALAEFFKDHSYDRHVRRMRSEYRRRREFLVSELATHVPDARVDGVAAGLQATVHLPEGADPDDVVAAALRRGLSFRTLADHATTPSPVHPPAVVVGYGATTAARASKDLATFVAAVAAGVRM